MDKFLPKSLWDLPLTFRGMNDFFDHSLSGVTISEDTDTVYIEAQVPGIPLKDIQVELNNGYLHIHAETKKEEKDRTFHRKAQSVFSYSLPIGKNVDTNKGIQATCKDGILHISFKKLEPSPSGKKIPITGS